MAHEIERLSTADAARRLGVSPSTVRRRIAAGHLRAERHPRPQGARWLVVWEEPTASATPAEVLEEISIGCGAASNERDEAPGEATEPVAWFWWFILPTALASGMALGRWFS